METIDVLIIGNGVAGVSAALAARRHPALADGARVVVACPEGEDFYYRAALTNYLLGELSRDELHGLPHGTLKQQRIERLYDAAVALDARARVVGFRSGLQLGYRRLLIASGASARLPGPDFAGVHGAFALRTIADATGLLAMLPATKRAVVLGGGILGLEVLEALHQRGVAVQLLHRGAQLLDRVVDATAGDLIRRRIENDGVPVRLGARFAGLDAANGALRGVRLEDGSTLPAEMVVSCVGAVPNTGWLRDTGVSLTEQGLVKVDRHLAVPGLEGVFAAGDVAAVDESELPFGNPAGLWQPARYQGRVAGRNLAEAESARHVAYSPGILLNSTRAWGMAVESAGAHPGTPGLERITSSGVDERGAVHKAAVFRDEKLAGFAMVGDRREARALATLLDLREAPRIPQALRQRLFDPGFDLHSWVAAQAQAAGPARWSQRDDDRLTVEAQGGSTKSAEPLSVFGTTTLGRPAASASAQRPLRLDVAGQAHTLTEGPVWIGDHEAARWAKDELLPREAALRLEPMGLAWMATTSQAVAAIRINGAVLRKPQFLADNDVIEVGKWRALVQGEAVAQANASAAPERAGWLVGPVNRFALVAEGTTRIGRLPENDLVLDRPGVGNFHAQIVADRGRWVLVDSGSPEGIAVNEQPDADFRPLQHGDRIRLGTETWRFELTDAVVEATAGVAGYLCPENGPDAGHALALRLRHGQLSIGRGESAQLRLADPLVSRKHALVRAVGGGLELLDHGSVNGVQVNGQRVEAEKPWRLHDGDEVRLGAYAYRFSKQLPLGRRVAAAARADAALGSTVIDSRKTSEPAAIATLRLEPRPNALFPGLVGAALDGSTALRVGRSSKVHESGAGLVIPAVTVSREHAEIAPNKGRWTLRDLGSREGTTHNGKPVGEVPVLLRDGDHIVFGHVAEFDVQLQAEAAAAGSAGGRGRTLSRTPMSAAFWLAAPNALEGDLRAMVETELDACIGCHACMRACPLPDAENVSIAALNQSAAMGRIADPRARRFVQECTQCQQCVPVCPVNIQRSRIVLWNKLKLDVDAELRPPMQAGEGAATMNETVAELARAYADHPLLGVLGDRDRLELLSRCQYRRLSDGEALFAQGSYVSTLWLVHEGEFDWQLATDGAELVNSLRLGPGMSIALREFVADEICERVASAAGPATAIGLPRALVSQFVRRNPALRDALTTQAADWDVFRRVPALAKLSLPDQKRLEAEAELALAAPGESLRGFGGGEQGAFVLRGFVAELIEAGGETVRAYHRAGAWLRLGGRNEPARYRAKTACELLLLPAGMEAKLELPKGAAATPGGVPVPPGKRIMAIDVARCVDCNNCVDACGRRHGHSRLDRQKQGVQIGGSHIPSACYHCEDPKCLLCDTGGIIREPSGEIRIVEENCIGCGSCASRCPYDNIRMVSRDKPAAAGVVSSLLELLHISRPAPEPETRGALLAVKCDLCVGYEDGPACVRACPTGAAQRVSLAEIAAGAEDLP